jgi:hypothetical protein
MRGTTRHLSISSRMDPGLSLRTRSTLDALLPAFSASAPPSQRPFDPFSTTIDLSRAVNEVLHPELLEFFKTTVEEKATSEVRSFQRSFCLRTGSSRVVVG